MIKMPVFRFQDRAKHKR